MPRPGVVPCVVLATALSCLPVAAGENPKAVLARVREYLAWYDRQLVTLIADEHYVQTNRVPGDWPTGTGRARELEAEFGWVAVSTLQDTIGVREVRRVDGRPVAVAYRLRALLEHPPEDPSSEARAILAESATHNIGRVRRNINFPTFALAYLRQPRPQHTKWRAVRAGDHVDLYFEERERSTLIRTPEGVPTPARGRFSVDGATGRIQACEVRVRVKDGHSSRRPIVYWMLVDFARDARLDLWVPVRMLERNYRDTFQNRVAGVGTGRVAEVEADGVSRLRHDLQTGEATYANYRRYETSGRLIP